MDKSQVYRVHNLNLGINLGWLQQGAMYGGRPVKEMTADLERVRGAAAQIGYAGHDGGIDAALGQLFAADVPSRIIDEVSELIGMFAAQAGPNAAALRLGILVGILQQGARGQNRPEAMAIADFEAARAHAVSAGYTGHDALINQSLAKLRGGQPLAVLGREIASLADLLQKQM